MPLVGWMTQNLGMGTAPTTRPPPPCAHLSLLPPPTAALFLAPPVPPEPEAALTYAAPRATLSVVLFPPSTATLSLAATPTAALTITQILTC